MRTGHDDPDVPIDGGTGCAHVRLSRGQLLGAAGVGILAAVLPGVQARADAGSAFGSVGMSFPFFPQVAGSYSPEELRDILDILDTLEHWRVAITTAALTRAAPPFDTSALGPVRAMLAAYVLHSDLLEELGARSLLTDFPVAPITVQQSAVYLRGNQIATNVLVAAYMTAAREFAEVGQPLLVKYAFQAGAVYSEHRVITRYLLGATGTGGQPVPNDKGFETDHFLYMRDAYAFVQGLFKSAPNAISVPYPGRAVALAAAGSAAGAIIQKAPNNAVVSTTGGAGAVVGERI